MGKFAFLFGYKGRVNRYQLLIGQCIAVGQLIAICMLSVFIPDPGRKFLMGASFLVAYVITFFIFTKRLHDVNKSGWYQLLTIIPIINFYLLILIISPGTPGPNQYGKAPIAPTPHP